MERFEYKVIIDDIGTLGGYGVFTPNLVTIHHSAVEGFLKDNDLNRYRRYKDYHGGVMPYHIVIPYEEDDHIYITQYLNLWTVHNGNSKGNVNALSVLVDGNFDIQEPLPVQLAKLKQVLDDIQSGWFENNGWTLPQIDVRNPALLDMTVNPLWESITVARLHYHNEIAQKHYPDSSSPTGWSSAATACCGKNFIPKVMEYRDQKGNVEWNFISKEEQMYKEKYEAEVKKKWQLINQLKKMEKDNKSDEKLIKKQRENIKTLKAKLETCQKNDVNDAEDTSAGDGKKTLQSRLDICRGVIQSYEGSIFYKLFKFFNKTNEESAKPKKG